MVTYFTELCHSSGLEMCEVEVDVLGSHVPNSSYGLCGRKATLNIKSVVSELRSCVKVEVDVLGSPSLIVLNVVYADVKQHSSGAV